MLERVDTPEAIEFVVNAIAEKATLLSMTLEDVWDASRLGGRKLSGPSMNKLMILWDSPIKDDSIRITAFRIWIKGIDKEHLNILKKINYDSPFYELAIQKRAELKDSSVIPELIPLLDSEFYWFNIAHYVWCKEIMDVTEKHLKIRSAGKDYSDMSHEISNLLTRIPKNDAELILEKYWGNIECDPNFIQAALYVGTEKCCQLAESSIRSCPKSIPIFKHIGFLFEFFGERRDRFSKQHLDRLIPYLDLFQEDEIWQLAAVSQRLGIPEWSAEHISSRLSPDFRKLYHPSNEDLFGDLNKFAAEGHQYTWYNIMHWSEEFYKRHDPNAFAIMDRWLSNNRTIRGLQVASALIEVRGKFRRLG
jgi:hypothetical protein